MSRVGRKPIEIPDGVKVEVKDSMTIVEGPRGKLLRKIHPAIGVKVVDGQVLVETKSRKTSGYHRSLHGLFRSLVFNMVKGVTEGYEKILEVRGVGYNVELKDTSLILRLGYSHPVTTCVPEGIKLEVTKRPAIDQLTRIEIAVRGIDKQLVGEFAARIRHINPPEPYKGKGIRYLNEYVKRKAGKTSA